MLQKIVVDQGEPVIAQQQIGQAAGLLSTYKILVLILYSPVKETVKISAL
jgi:hypothetical protein